MFKYIAILFIIGCDNTTTENNTTDTSEELTGLPEGTECNSGGLCVYECSGQDCKDGVDLDGGIMVAASCCHYDSGDNIVCESAGWYERQSDGFIIADCDDDICRLAFQI